VRAAVPGRSRSLGGISYGARRAGLADAGADAVANGQLPPQYQNAAKEALLFWANSLDRAVDAIHQGDLAHVHDLLANMEESYDVSETGWMQGRASKEEALSVLRQALAEAERKAPGWFQAHMGAPPKQVEAFVAAAQVIAVRMRARANSGDFDHPAVLTPEEQAVVAKGESIWGAKVADDQARATGDLCAPARLLTGETSVADYWSNCAPSGVRYAFYGLAALLTWKLYRWVTE
jgi:hypothetical protein